MDFGVILPRTVLGAAPTAVQNYALEAETAGYQYLQLYDHVLGENPAKAGSGFDRSNSIHEPLVLSGFLAGVTEYIDLVTGILVLPQRQTVLVAKQATEVDILSDGRFRLGVGVGWNDIEYEALGIEFGSRGSRIEEQVALLRKLWTTELVTYDGKFHTISDAGLNPLPVQQPIPIWMGGDAGPVLRRVGQVADGWIAPEQPPQDICRKLEKIHTAATQANRDPNSLSVICTITLGADDEEDAWLGKIEKLQEIGCTHLSVNTLDAGFDSRDEHRRAIQNFSQRAQEAGYNFHHN